MSQAKKTSKTKAERQKRTRISQSTHLSVHGIQPVRCNNIPCVDQAIERARRLCEVRVVRIVIGADAIQNQIQAIGKVGDTGS